LNFGTSPLFHPLQLLVQLLGHQFLLRSFDGRVQDGKNFDHELANQLIRITGALGVIEWMLAETRVTAALPKGLGGCPTVASAISRLQLMLFKAVAYLENRAAALSGEEHR
jgi:hypothetical protein